MNETHPFSKYLILWLPVFIWCSLIFYFSSLSLLPKIHEGLWDIIFKKLAHFSEYAVLALLLRRALAHSTAWLPEKVNLWACGLAILYAVSDEIHQFLVPLRNAEVYDVMIDSFGAFCAIFVFNYWKKRSYSKREDGEEYSYSGKRSGKAR